MRKILLVLFLLIVNLQSVLALDVGEEQVVNARDNLLSSLFSTETLLNMIFAIVIVILTFVVALIVKMKLFGYLERKVGQSGSGKVELVGLITRSVNIAIYVTGFSITLGVLGVDLGIFMGGIGFGIGFTLKTFLTNFVAGIIMITQGKFNNGDLIEMGSVRGKIFAINALFTEVEQLDGVVAYIPNVRFLEENVLNFHTNDKRRLEVELLVEYTTDISKTKMVLSKVLESFPTILKSPEYKIIVEKLDDSGILVRVLFWTNSKESYISIKSNVTETINLAFKQSEIKMAYPHIEIVK
ncbi:mechanosensitive ion channel [Candidatus Gracilibacteria bacterium]|nr:mechanosensitive ion channel [Candidatus Gracilibacteria bacterium]